MGEVVKSESSNVGEAVSQPSGMLVDTIDATDRLVTSVGPEWGLAIVIAIMLFFPRLGVISYLAKLWKEDRADARKQKIESERLAYRYRNRATSKDKSPPSKSDQ